MATVLVVLTWALGALLFLLLAVFLTPLRIELLAVRDEALHFEFALRPLGRIGPRISLTDGSRKKKKKPKSTIKGRKKRSTRWQRNPTDIMHAVIRLLADVVKQIRIERASLDLRFGYGDPGDTGQVFGMLTPIMYGLGETGRADIRVVPVFDRAELTGRAALDVSFIPLLMLRPFAQFGWSMIGPRR